MSHPVPSCPLLSVNECVLNYCAENCKKDSSPCTLKWKKMAKQKDIVTRIYECVLPTEAETEAEAEAAAAALRPLSFTGLIWENKGRGPGQSTGGRVKVQLLLIARQKVLGIMPWNQLRFMAFNLPWQDIQQGSLTHSVCPSQDPRKSFSTAKSDLGSQLDGD